MVSDNRRPPWDSTDWQLALEAIAYYRRTAELDESTSQHAVALLETIASSGVLAETECVWFRGETNNSHRISSRFRTL